MRRLLFVAFLIIVAMAGVIAYLLKGPQRALGFRPPRRASGETGREASGGNR